ncbi:SE1832 family protein [Fervidibacillus halotolerans]|uniref:SE1832 family protein n=1 Tax=Fervidibacillus halotolerans TaxID=2980027 RepID=A0A9E8M1V2_9BACI|nr:SE1832 family protein [Fervidibacillus halotolerans]WAA13988.1 SE1832 family protein [Fervidibacillus halotolerans]
MKALTREEIFQRIEELKSDYVRIQADVEKATAVGGSIGQGEKVLQNIEEELRKLRKMLDVSYE